MEKYDYKTELAMKRSLRCASEGRYPAAAQNLIDASPLKDSESAMSSLSFKLMVLEEEKEIQASVKCYLKRQLTHEPHSDLTKDDGSDARSLSIYSRKGRRSAHSITRDTADDSSTSSQTQQQLLIIRPGWVNGVSLVESDDSAGSSELASSIYSASDS